MLFYKCSLQLRCHHHHRLLLFFCFIIIIVVIIHIPSLRPLSPTLFKLSLLDCWMSFFPSYFSLSLFLFILCRLVKQTTIAAKWKKRYRKIEFFIERLLFILFWKSCLKCWKEWMYRKKKRERVRKKITKQVSNTCKGIENILGTPFGAYFERIIRDYRQDH